MGKTYLYIVKLSHILDLWKQNRRSVKHINTITVHLVKNGYVCPKVQIMIYSQGMGGAGLVFFLINRIA